MTDTTPRLTVITPDGEYATDDPRAAVALAAFVRTPRALKLDQAKADLLNAALAVVPQEGACLGCMRRLPLFLYRCEHWAIFGFSHDHALWLCTRCSSRGEELADDDKNICNELPLEPYDGWDPFTGPTPGTPEFKAAFRASVRGGKPAPEGGGEVSPIQPDLSDKQRCASVHWVLPVQCELPPTHRENWHETRHPESARPLRYNYPSRSTEEMLEDGCWYPLDIAKPIPASEQRIRDRIADAIRDLKQDYPDNIKAWVALGHAEAIARGRQFSLGIGDLKTAPHVVHAMYGGVTETVDGRERPVTPCGFREPQRATGVHSEITCSVCLDVLARDAVAPFKVGDRVCIVSGDFEGCLTIVHEVDEAEEFPYVVYAPSGALRLAASDLKPIGRAGAATR